MNWPDAPTTTESESPWPKWFVAARRADVAEAMADLLHRHLVEVEKLGSVCAMSGRCCRFEEFGHRLYVTGLEAAWFIAQLDGALLDPTQVNPGGCPYQVENRCTVHQIRPFGCRVFFCDSATLTQQNDIYERYHQTMRDLHERFGIEYQYLEWREALRQAAEMPTITQAKA